MILQPPFLKPFFDVVCNFPVVCFLEHKVAVAHNAGFWKIYHSRVSAVGIIVFSKINGSVADIFPEPVFMMSAGSLSM